jgi:uncharacterized protein (DUF1810 family)/Mg-chelatase subunit ChlD
MLRIFARIFTLYHLKTNIMSKLSTNEKRDSGKRQVHNLIILDESGSMSSIKRMIVSGFNELVQSIKETEKQFPDQEHLISLISFNSSATKVIHFTDPAVKLKEIDHSQYNPGALTPLFDTIGFSINKLNAVLPKEDDYNVLVTIMTDGMENASREYSGAAIKKLIEEMKEKNWTFTYIGTDHDIESLASSISIDNRMCFAKTKGGIEEMFQKERYARKEYSRKIHTHEDEKQMYFDEGSSIFRFFKSQERDFQTAIAEIRGGLKTGHWMWYMFPQIQGLGHSSISRYYAIRNLDEARLFLREPCGDKLIALANELLKTPENDAEKIFGHVDALKLRSCMTLFSQVEHADKVFQAVLDKFFDGKPDDQTLQILASMKM